MAKILIVDDEPRIRDLIREHLQYAGFTCEEAGDGTAALSALSQGGIDLVILDIMMPFMDGMTCLREMRTRKIMTPVIMLTARSEEYDKLAGLESGADDYVVKPFSPRELVARVKAVLARTMPKPAEDSGSYTFGDLHIDTASHSVKVAGQEAPLTPKEFDLLVFLVSNKGIALSREKILQKVWNYDYYGEDRTVDTHVKMLPPWPLPQIHHHRMGHRVQIRPGYAMRKPNTPKKPFALSIRWQLMLFIGGITLFTLLLVWGIITYALAPQYNRNIRNKLDAKAAAITALIDQSDSAISNRSYLGLTLNEDFWDGVSETFQDKKINVDSCCVDFSDTTLRCLKAYESMYPCLLHESTGAFDGAFGYNVDTHLAI